MKRILLSAMLVIGIGALAGCQTCDVCDDCGDPICDPHFGAYKQRCCGCGTGWHTDDGCATGCGNCGATTVVPSNELKPDSLKPVPAPANSTSPDISP
jgi:hypothetical protein